LAQAGRPEELACIVASLHRPELTLDFFRHKPKNHRKGEQTTQEDEIHEQGCRQGGLLCHLCTYKHMVSFNPLAVSINCCSALIMLQGFAYKAELAIQCTQKCAAFQSHQEHYQEGATVQLALCLAALHRAISMLDCPFTFQTAHGAGKVPGARYNTAYTLNRDICRLSPLVQ